MVPSGPGPRSAGTPAASRGWNDTYLDSSFVVALTSAHLADLRSARSEDQELKLKAR